MCGGLLSPYHILPEAYMQPLQPSDGNSEILEPKYFM